MEIYSVITTIVTLITGGGWFIYYRANKRKANGEATQSEAEGWKKQQEVYESTIESQRTWYNRLKDDFNAVVDENSRLRKENEELRKENQLLRARINELESQFNDMRRDLARQGRRIEALSNKDKKRKDV